MSNIKTGTPWKLEEDVIIIDMLKNKKTLIDIAGILKRDSNTVKSRIGVLACWFCVRN
jgi:hypothetical protein